MIRTASKQVFALTNCFHAKMNNSNYFHVLLSCDEKQPHQPCPSVNNTDATEQAMMSTRTPTETEKAGEEWKPVICHSCTKKVKDRTLTEVKQKAAKAEDTPKITEQGIDDKHVKTHSVSSEQGHPVLDEENLYVEDHHDIIYINRLLDSQYAKRCLQYAKQCLDKVKGASLSSYSYCWYGRRARSGGGSGLFFWCYGEMLFWW